MSPFALQRALAVTVVLTTALARAQPPAEEPAQPEKAQLSLEVGVLSASVDFAHRLSPRLLLGAGGGVGLQVLSHVFAGQHFSDRWMSDKAFDLVEGRLFLRNELTERWTLDVGARLARVFHVHTGDAEVTTHQFIGAYATPMFGWRHFKLGPTVSAGVFSVNPELAQPATREFGVRLTALTGRFTLHF